MLSGGGRIQRLVVGFVLPPILFCAVFAFVGWMLDDGINVTYALAMVALGPPVALATKWFVFLPYAMLMEVLHHVGVTTRLRVVISTTIGAAVALVMAMSPPESEGFVFLVGFGAVAGFVTGLVLDRIGAPGERAHGDLTSPGTSPTRPA